MNPNFLRFMIGDLLAQKSFKEDTESQWRKFDRDLYHANITHTRLNWGNILFDWDVLRWDVSTSFRLTGMRTVWQNWSTLKKLRQETRT